MRLEFVREVMFYVDYFRRFYLGVNNKARIKVDWTIILLETVEHIPEKHFKHLTNTDGINEIRVECESNINRIF